MASQVHRVAKSLIGISLIVMAVAGYASNQLLDENAFASLVSSSVEREEVRSLLSTKAVDVAIDASNADARLAAALPDEYSLVATPALEVSKPAIASAGAALLGVDAVEASLETAARSVHRQTASAILAEDEVDVTINTLPVLVVVADEIAGDVGARAAVGLDLPDSATSIDLGSNRDATWTIIRSLSYVAALALMLWLLAMIVYFATAGRGRRMDATRRLGRTFVLAGIVVAVIGWGGLVIAGVAIELALSPDEALSFGGITLGGVSRGGGVALAEVLLGPLVGAGRRSILTGVVIVGATYFFGSGQLAQAARTAIRERNGDLLAEAVRDELPRYVRHVQRSTLLGLAVLLLVWPQITMRVALTLSLLAMATMLALAIATGTRSAAVSTRSFLGTDRIEPLDTTDRSKRAGSHRRWLVGLGALVALVWPRYDTTGFVTLAFFTSLAFALTYRWELRSPEATVDLEIVGAESDDRWSVRRKLVVGGVVAAGVALLTMGGDASNPAAAASFALPTPDQCNGHVELCDVPLNEMAFAGTHNSMSASSLGWELANHDSAIPAQLAGGIRALLIDVQYWPKGESIADLELDPAAAEIAARALAIDEAPEDGLWMCHKLCQLGGTPFSDFLADLRVFLETNPDEVLIIVIQDDAPATDIKAAIEAASIDDFAYAHEPTQEWPTLGEMIQANERLVFMAENDADESGWYQLAFEGNVSETGFRYSVVEDFDCAESRGGNDGDFFMINHWVETGLPVPSEADQVNSSAILRARVDECIRARDRQPGIIAVNFWERGDLLQFVDELNAVGAG